MSVVLTHQNRPFIGVKALADSLLDPDLILLDATMLMPTPQGRAAYRPEIRIGEARYFNFDTEICDHANPLPHMMPTAEQFQQQVRALGINQDSQIVVYDTLGLFSAARAWWMFRAMGHENIAVLDGGLPAWQRAGMPTNPYKSGEKYSEGDFIAQPQAALFCDAEQVLSALSQPDIKVIDARSAERFAGSAAEPRPGMRSGHMPNALNLPFASLLQADGCLQPDEQLVTLFAEQVGNAEQYIFSCGSGVTACILALVADKLGYKSLSVYDGSWSEWGARQDLPIEPSN